MTASFTIFYAWQSQLPNPTNRGFIWNELETVIKDFQSEDVVVVIDRDTAGVPGAPDIGQTILEKIGASDLFVGDLSIVNGDAPEERRTSNPNVLVETGYALGTIGPRRVLLVMNTAFGRPEDLPFDLRGKRALTYELPKDNAKDAARKALRGQLRGRIEEAIAAHRETATTAAPVASPTKEVVDAIEASRPNQGPLAKRFVQGLADSLVKIDAESKKVNPPARTDALFTALEASKPVVNDFGVVARAVAEMNTQEAVHGLVQGFEYILARYDLQGAGTAWPGDFDLYRFVGHELLAVLSAHLIRAERWTMFPSLFSERIHTRASEPVGIDYACNTVELLDRTSRSGQPIMGHAQILKERHEATPPLGDVSFPELIAGDVMLYLGVRPWFPWSSLFIARKVPRFLKAAATPDGARNLAAALNTPILVQMKAEVTQAITGLRQNLANSGAWMPWHFDPATIYGG